MSEDEPLTAWFAALPAALTDGCDLRAIAAAKSAYNSPGRHYHTWEHALACVDQLGRISPGAPRATFLAIVFHDAIYIPGRDDNEQRSAELARQTLSTLANVSDVELASIERMILATRDHHALAATLSPDEALMLDIDLSVLAAARDAYALYARAIRDEYVPAVATETMYRIGRRAFLGKLAAAQHIFLTAECQRRWDAVARENLRWEDAELAQEQGAIERAITSIKKHS